MNHINTGVAAERDAFMCRMRNILSESTREVVRAVECSCYGYNRARTNSRDGSLSRGAHLPQHAHELPVALSRVRPRLARPVAALALREGRMVTTAVGLLRRKARAR